MKSYLKYIDWNSIKNDLFMANSDYIDLFDNDHEPMEKTAQSLVESYCWILDIYTKMPILPKYDISKPKKDNLLSIKDNIKNDILTIKDKLDILKTGNIASKLFDDDFFSRWSFSEDFIIISYLIKHHPSISEEYIESKFYSVSKCYVDLEYNFIDSLNFLINNEDDFFNRDDFTIRIPRKWTIRRYFYNKIYTMYPLEYLNNIAASDTKTYEFIQKLTAYIEFNTRINNNDEVPFLLEEDNVIDIHHVFSRPEYYESSNKPKIFSVGDSFHIPSQEYLEIVFDLIVKGKFTIVNLYRCTDGNLEIFKCIELLTENETLNNMYRDLENNEDIIEFIMSSDLCLKDFIFKYLLFCEMGLTGGYRHGI